MNGVIYGATRMLCELYYDYNCDLVFLKAMNYINKLYKKPAFFAGFQWRKIQSFILGMLIFCHFFLFLMNWGFTMPADGLDPSWVAVLTHAASHGWQWGKDIVFNYGPFGFLWIRQFDEHLVFATLGLQLLWAACLSWGVARLLSPLPLVVALIAYSAIALGLLISWDGSYFLPCLLIALGYFRFPTPVSTRALLPLVIAAGIGSMIKLTYGMISLIVLFIVDAHRLFNRRWPVYTPVMLIVFFFLYLLSGQSLSYFQNFLKLSLEIVAGHSSAMAIPGPWQELAAFLGLSGIAWLLLIWHQLESRHLDPHSSYGHILALFLVLGLFWLITFKQGFVRHDLHTLAAWGGMAALFAAVTATLWLPQSTGNKLMVGLLVIAICSAFLGLFRLQLDGNQTVVSLVRITSYEKPYREWKNFREWLKSPEAWTARIQYQKDIALAHIRDRHPMPQLQGSVDIIPSMQSVILAYGYDYRPRPIFQDYVDYTPQLIAANREFFQSERAPEYLFFSPGAIDNRYPSSTEGAIWPDILSRYQLDRMVQDDLILLKRRTQPLGDLLNDNAMANYTLQFDKPFFLNDQAPVFAKIFIKQSVFGKLAKLLFKPAPVFIRVKLRNGEIKLHRLIPEMASEGFLLSPYINNCADFALLTTGKMSDLIKNQVEEVSIETSQFGPFYYQEPLLLSLQPLHQWY